MLHYLKNENIKKSSNYLEWLNWVLDTNILRHKWLRIDRLISFVFFMALWKKFKRKIIVLYYTMLSFYLDL